MPPPVRKYNKKVRGKKKIEHSEVHPNKRQRKENVDVGETIEEEITNDHALQDALGGGESIYEDFDENE